LTLTIENQGFNDSKDRYGLERNRDHHLTRTAIELLRLLLLTLSVPAFDSS
jgi:hypothetical protein